MKSFMFPQILTGIVLAPIATMIALAPSSAQAASTVYDCDNRRTFVEASQDVDDGNAVIYVTTPRKVQIFFQEVDVTGEPTGKHFEATQRRDSIVGHAMPRLRRGEVSSWSVTVYRRTAQAPIEMCNIPEVTLYRFDRQVMRVNDAVPAGNGEQYVAIEIQQDSDRARYGNIFVFGKQPNGQTVRDDFIPRNCDLNPDTLLYSCTETMPSGITSLRVVLRGAGVTLENVVIGGSDQQ